MVDFTNLNNTAKPTTTAGTAPADVYNPNPYDWKTLLANYVDPTTAQYQTQARPFTPSYGYEYTQLQRSKGLTPALRYDVADPAAASSAYANTILQDYNTRNPTKTSSTFNQAALDNYIKNYNSANNINLTGFKKTVTPEQQAAILAQYGKNKTALTDSMYNSYIADYNKNNDLTAAQEQQKIVDEYNASRTANQNTYNTNVADYNTRAADVQANPQNYNQPVHSYAPHVINNTYYDILRPKAAGTTSSTGATTVGNEQHSFDPFTIGKNGERIIKPELIPGPDVATTNLARGGYIQGYACGGLMRKYADGGAVQPQQPMVQDMMQRYNIQRQSISPLNALPSQQAPMMQPQQAPMMQPQQAPMAPQQAPMAQPRPFYNGGAVRGYAGGDLVTDDGGQAFADSYMAGQQQFPTQQDAPIAQMAQRYNIDPEQSKSYADQRALFAQLQTALSKQQPKNTNVSNAETYFKLMGALGKPTKYGSFGESFGNVGEVMAEDQAARREAARANTGQDIANIQARMGLMQAQRELGRDERQSNMIAKYLGGEGAGGQGGTQGGDAGGIPNNMKALLLSLDPKEAVKTIVDLAKEQNKPSDLIKGVKFLINNGSISPEQGDEIVQEHLQGKLEQVDVSVPELNGLTFKFTGPEARKYYESGALPTRLAPKGAQASLTPGAAQPAQAQQQAPLSLEEVEAKKTGLIEQSKADIEAANELLNKLPKVTSLRDASTRASAMVKKYPNAIGIISAPGISNAISTAVTQGLSTPFGAISIDIEEPLAKLKLKPEELDARRAIAQAEAQQLFVLRSIDTTKGQGSFTEGEQATLGRGLALKSDSAPAFLFKNGLVIIRGEKEAAVIDAFGKYKETHPAAGPRSFYQTPEYKRIADAYDKKYYKFVEKSGYNLNEFAPNKKSSESLAERLTREERQNKEGK
jgi:hypothetical protein